MGSILIWFFYYSQQIEENSGLCKACYYVVFSNMESPQIIRNI